MSGTVTSGVDRLLLRRFRSRIEQRLRVERLLVFGSRARGAQRPDSDYDLILVSPDFEGVRPLWRGQGLNVVWNDLHPGVDVEIICVTPREFESAAARPTSWLHAAVQEALVV